ncbi:substrate-binding domain-containing protein [Gracilibacillus phocaeensis]|uniref:substrate-binding domain-containing protein n=1 Tax=Gracilibacillus phocaeensis TaxID=2042304 RepID=UPI0010301516|nr:substrate-binding domain-containing protein [Gracilibacillus phocaeensis]
MLRKIGFLVLFIISFSFMIYYGKETFYIDQKASTEMSHDYHFALITEEVGNEYWRLIEKGAKQAAEENDVYLEYVGPKLADDEERLETFDRMIAADVDGIIVKGMNDERFPQLVKKAKDRKIPVATIDTDNPTSNRDFYVGTDNFQAGYLAGRTLIKETEGKQKIAVIIGLKEAQNQLDRLAGFEKAIEDVDRMELIGVSESRITEVGAADGTYQLLKNHGNITVFFGVSALDGIGIVQAIEEINPTSRPYVLAFDLLPETLSLIENDKIQATVAQYPQEMGQQAVEQMVQWYQNQQPDSIQHTETGIIKQEDILNGEIIPKEEQ